LSGTEIFKVGKYDGERQVVWDASSLGALQDCPTKYHLGYVLGWGYRSRDPARNWGSAVHLGLEVYEKLLIAGTDREAALRKALTAVIENHSDLTESKDTARTLDTALRAVVWHVDTPALWDDTVATWTEDGQEVPALECRFEVAIPGLEGYRFSGSWTS